MLIKLKQNMKKLFITSKSKIPKNQRFDLKNFKVPFCSNEKKMKYKRFEAFDPKNKKFWKPNYNFRNLGKILIISGPARNGNHILYSLFDGHSQVSTMPGEDFLIREFFSRAKENEAEAIKNLKGPNNIEYILNMSGGNFNKWKKLYDLYINNKSSKIWSGQQPENHGHVTDYQDLVPQINYPKFEKYLYSQKEKIKKIKNFYEFLSIYLKATKILTNSPKKKINFSWFFSGMRRELFSLLKCTKNIICFVPIRRFETFYFSYAKSRFKTNQIEQRVLNELWEHWRHKTIDYLILKKKFPKKVIFVRFEDLINKTEPTIKKLNKKLKIKFEKIQIKPTTLKKSNKGNSSFPKENKYFGKIYKNSTYKKFKNKVQLPKEYFEIYNNVLKNLY